jgi:hypothetical protein
VSDHNNTVPATATRLDPRFAERVSADPVPRRPSARDTNVDEQTEAEFHVEEPGVKRIYGVVGNSRNGATQLIDLAKVNLCPADRGLSANCRQRVGQLVEAREDLN